MEIPKYFIVTKIYSNGLCDNDPHSESEESECEFQLSTKVLEDDILYLTYIHENEEISIEIEQDRIIEATYYGEITKDITDCFIEKIENIEILISSAMKVESTANYYYT